MNGGRTRMAMQGTLAAIIAATSPIAGAAQSPLPSALPTNSAFREDASPVDRQFFDLPSIADGPAQSTSAAREPGAAYIVLPNAPAPIFADDGPYLETALPDVSVRPEDEFPKRVYPAPPFSWRPSYVTPGARQGVFQQGLLRTTYLPRLNENGFGMTSLARQVTLALPPFIYGSPILFTPSYTAHFLDGPGPGDAPPRLHDIEFEFRYLKQATPRLGLDLAFAPSYFGDFDNDSSDAWRITGKAIAAWDWSAKLQVVAGGLYLGRSDLQAVPVGGVVWKPAPQWRIDALVPRPRVYYRTYRNGDVEHWVFVGGEFGGNTWAIDRTGDIPDKFTYADLRLVAAWERRVPLGFNGRIEAGWIFDRSIEYTSGFPGFDPTDTFMIRAEASF